MSAAPANKFLFVVIFPPDNWFTLILTSSPPPLSQYARDFYIAQWIYDSQVELEKLLKDPSTIDDLDAIDTAEITNSAMAMQQSETKISMLRSLLNPKKRNSLKRLEGVLDDKRAVVVTKSLASYRALSKSFDMYLRDVSCSENT